MGQTSVATAEKQTISYPEVVTPMMQQYLEVKRQHPGYLLFYRMGDFYEMFFEDAVCAAEILDIALTKRGKHQDVDIPMCGVPWHSYEVYLHKLIKAGQKVAICEQMESPEEAKKRGAKSVVKREVVRIITAGTLVEDGLLDARQANYLVCVVHRSGEIGLSWVDMSTGEFVTGTSSKQTLTADLARLSPTELLISEQCAKESFFSEAFAEYRNKLTIQVNSLFDYTKAIDKLKSTFGVATIDGFGNFSTLQIIGAGALLEYLSITQKGQLPRLSYPRTIEHGEFMQMDAATRRNLEIQTTLSGDKKGSVVDVMDKTLTSAGARLLRRTIAAPLTSVDAINSRLDKVEFFADGEEVRASVRAILRQVPDIERALSRLCLQKGGPADIQMIALGLRCGKQMRDLLEQSGLPIPSGMASDLNDLGQHDALVSHMSAALIPEPPRFVRDGHFIADGYDAALDELRRLSTNSKEAVDALRDEYRLLSGVQTLKITHNNVLGYFIEVTPAHQGKMTDEVFIHRQTLGSGVRYSTVALKTLESDIMHAADEALKLETLLFEKLRQALMQESESIALAAHAIATLDVSTALAELAVRHHYIRPQVDASNAFIITGGRHLVVEAMMQQTSRSSAGFVANDCNLSPVQRLWLLTGPNMAGKSTFLRQNALIVLMAQMGSFVPARSAYIGVVDKLFSRVGASDDLARGRSTFMVEMVETAAILHQATARSLVILDEIGRGTSTYDGLSIAWSVVEYLHNHSKCRALFATHYHELTSLAGQLAAMTCYTMQVKEWEGEVIFMHQLIPGAADRSYGIHVAKLAGLPKQVIARANHILSKIEATEINRPVKALMSDLPLFARAQEQEAVLATTEQPVDEIRQLLNRLSIDELSPKEALDMLYQLVTLAKNNE